MAMIKSLALAAGTMLLSGGALALHGTSTPPMSSTREVFATGVRAPSPSLNMATSTGESISVNLNSGLLQIDGGNGTVQVNILADAAQALGMTMNNLRTDLQSGTGLAKLASQNGSSAAALEATLTQDVTTAITNAVNSGSLSSSQASGIEQHLSKMIDGLVTGIPPGPAQMFGGPGGAVHFDLLADAAKALGLSTSTLQSDLQSGSTLATLAAQNGSSATALEATLTQDITTAITNAVNSGSLTSGQATKLEQRLSPMIDGSVTGTLPAPIAIATNGGPGQFFVKMGLGSLAVGGPGGAVHFNLLADAAKALGLSTSTLQSDLQSGSTLATLAAQNGSSATALEATLTQDATSAITNAVNNGSLSATLATRFESHLTSIIDAIVTGTPPAPIAMSQS